MTLIRANETPMADAQEDGRRVPVQSRSRARVERILTVAASLIAAHGSDALRMSDVAEMADVSIGSLYQYFPDKSAVIRTLAERFNALGQECVAREFVQVRSEDDLREALVRSIDGYYAMFLDEPVMRDIWSGTQADRSLQDLAVSDVRAHAALLSDTLVQLRPAVHRATLEVTSLLLMQLMDATVRLAVSVGREEGDALVETFKQAVLPTFRFD